MSPRAGKGVTAAMIAASAALALFLLHPLRRGSPFADDHIFIALGRHLDQPLALLTSDAVGTYFFRPIGMLLWWVTARIGGDDVAWHYGINMALHAANGVLLFAALRTCGVRAAAAAATGLAFIAHPTPFAAAAWLSDRFDLLATSFGLLTLIAIERYFALPRVSRLVAVAIAAAAAIFSKETGFAIVAAMGVLAVWRAPQLQPGRRGPRFAVAAALAGAIALGLAARYVVLRPLAESLLMHAGPLATLTGGLTRWMVQLPWFVAVHTGPRTATVLTGLAIIAWLVVPLRPRTLGLFMRSGLARPAALGLVIAAFAAAAQTPVLNALAFTGFRGPFDFATLAASRFYYVAFAGMALVLGTLAEAFLRDVPSNRAPWAALMVAAIAVCAPLATDRAIGRAYADESRESSGRDRASAIAAVGTLGGLAPGCKIYLLGSPHPAFRHAVDSAVKSGLPHGHPAFACFILAEHAPWYNLVPGGLSAAPLEQAVVAGRGVEPLQVGALEYHYLRIPDSAAVREDPRAIFLALTGDRFVDVTTEVRDGRRTVHFHDERPTF